MSELTSYTNALHSVKCTSCNWKGYDAHLVPVCKSDPTSKEGVIPTPSCPECLSDQWLVFDE